MKDGSSKSEFLFLKFVFIFGENTFGIGESYLYFFWLLDIGNLVVAFGYSFGKESDGMKVRTKLLPYSDERL